MNGYDLLGVTSIVRALGLEPAGYDRLQDFFPSPALDLNKLTRAGCALVFRFNSGIVRVNLKPVLVGRRHQGRQGRTQNARGQKAPSRI